MIMKRDGLTDDEFEEGRCLAIGLMKRDGVTAFYADCERFCKIRTLSRAQLNRLRFMKLNPYTKTSHLRRFPATRRKSVITLATHA